MSAGWEKVLNLKKAKKYKVTEEPAQHSKLYMSVTVNAELLFCVLEKIWNLRERNRNIGMKTKFIVFQVHISPGSISYDRHPSDIQMWPNLQPVTAATALCTVIIVFCWPTHIQVLGFSRGERALTYNMCPFISCCHPPHSEYTAEGLGNDFGRMTVFSTQHWSAG